MKVFFIIFVLFSVCSGIQSTVADPIHPELIVPPGPKSSTFPIASSSKGLHKLASTVGESTVEVIRTERDRWNGRRKLSYSGIAIAERNGYLYVLTSSQAVSNGGITVQVSEETEARATCVGIDNRLNLGLIRISTPRKFSTLLPRISESPALGEKAIVVGMARGLGLSTLIGHLSGLNRTVGTQAIPHIQLLLPNIEGLQGSLVMNKNSKAIGVLTGFHSEASKISYVVPMKAAQNFFCEHLKFLKVCLG